MRFSPGRKIAALAALFALCAGAFSQKVAFDTSQMDTSVQACDDFYHYAVGNWLKRTEIPPAYPAWGGFMMLAVHNRELSRDILEAAKKANAPKGSDQQLIGDYYAACMDESAIEAAGISPLKPYLREIDGLKNSADVKTEIARLHRLGVAGVFGFFAYSDQKNAGMNIANVYQGGMSLPSRDYYTNDDAKSQEIRAKYVAHVARMFELLGDTPAVAKQNADTVMRMEMRFALAAKTPVELRDPAKNYNKMSVAEADKLMSGFGWEHFRKVAGAPRFSEIDLWQADFFKEAGKMIADVPIANWKTFFRWNIVHTWAPQLPKKFDDENFEFFQKTLWGTTEKLPRWLRCTGNTDNAVGEALGQEFVKQHFKPEAKKRMDELITNLFAALKQHIEGLDWMTDATRSQALAKLAAIKRKIGYPDTLRGYKGLSISRSSYFENTVRATEYTGVRDLQDIGKPLDRTRWDMTPPTVNAYYNPNQNEIVFPAGILQPPFFNPDADDAINYGGIAAVIGHEMTHGFDDQGSQYDAEGNLKMWWTTEDRKKFDAKADCVADQFSSYEVLPGLNMNGRLTLGEDLADLGGVAIAYDAFMKSMEGKPRPAKIDGFTPEQRFFLGNAQIWAEKARPEATRMGVLSDPHAVSEFRNIGPLSNMPQFAQAFGCRVGNKMVRERPCKVW